MFEVKGHRPLLTNDNANYNLESRVAGKCRRVDNIYGYILGTYLFIYMCII